MKKKSILYVFLMVVFFILAYIFIDRGINTKSKVYVNYQVDDDISYRVYLDNLDNYNDKYLTMGNSYIASLVDYIDINYDYDILYSEDFNGYYSYNIVGKLVAYEDDISNSLWEREYKILEDKIDVIDENDINSIKINDRIKLDYDVYREEIYKFIKDYEIDVSGYLMLEFNIKTVLDFNNLSKSIDDSRVVKMIIPLTYDTFKINMINDNEEIDTYYDFSTDTDINYVLLLIGVVWLSLGLALLVLVIKKIVDIRKRENKYVYQLNRILREYGDIIINVKKFYNIKKYNLIYVDSFLELIDVYKSIEVPISYREMKKRCEAIFLIIDGDNAWIYRMTTDNFK